MSKAFLKYKLFHFLLFIFSQQFGFWLCFLNVTILKYFQNIKDPVQLLKKSCLGGNL